MKKSFTGKFLSVLVSTQLLAGAVLADVPSLPRDENGKPIAFEQYGKLNEHQKKEFGAFMLFYELVSSGKIGGNTGLCLSYEAGGNGNQDKISIGLDSKSYPTGIYDIAQVPVEKLNNLNTLLKEIGGYLDSGCQEGESKEACRQGRSVNITGYADAQHYGGVGIRKAKTSDEKSSLIEKSIAKNIELSENRAKMFSQIVSGAGFVDKDQIGVAGKVSPIGEYLQEGLPVPQQYQSADQKIGKADYKVDCPERRVTVIDVKFNGQSSNVKATLGTMSPVLRSATKNFVRRSNMGASIQTYKAAKALGMNDIDDDKEADKVIDKILDMNGVTSQSMRAACKNLQARSMVKQHLKQVNKLSSDSKSKLATTSELELLKLSKLKERDKGYNDNKEVIKYFDALPDGYGGSAALAADPLLKSDGGLSTSLNDCFSAKAAMQMEFDDARDPKNTASQNQGKLCQPVGDNSANGDVNIKFDPKQLHDHTVLHIGCQNCQTGFRYVPEKYKNPETGKEEERMVPVFIDREASISDENKANPILSSYRPIEPKEVDALVANKKALDVELAEKLKEAKKERDNAPGGVARSNANTKVNFLTAIQALNAGASSTIYDRKIDMNKVKPNDPTTSFNVMDFENPLFMKLAQENGINIESVKMSTRTLDLIYKSPYGKLEKDYVRSRLAGKDDVTVKRYEQVIIPGIQARDVLTNWNGTNTEKDNSMLFGSFKKPRYYLLENCDCGSDHLMEDAEKNGKLVTLDRIPAETKKEKLSKNACIISMPLPPSCMVNPNEKGTAEETNKGVESVRWMGLNGKNMEKALGAMMGHFADENKKVTLTGCEGLTPMEVAEKIVRSAECSGENRIPEGEAFDCRNK